MCGRTKKFLSVLKTILYCYNFLLTTKQTSTRKTFSYLPIAEKKITTIGAKWSDMEAKDFNSNSQPNYVIMDGNGNVLVPPQGANYSVANYIKFLDSGLSAYKAAQ